MISGHKAKLNIGILARQCCGGDKLKLYGLGESSLLQSFFDQVLDESFKMVFHIFQLLINQ